MKPPPEIPCQLKTEDVGVRSQLWQVARRSKFVMQIKVLAFSTGKTFWGLVIPLFLAQKGNTLTNGDTHLQTNVPSQRVTSTQFSECPLCLQLLEIISVPNKHILGWQKFAPL